MNTKALKTLEFDKILKLLSDCATSAKGKEKCRRLVPQTDPQRIKELLKNTSDALNRMRLKGSSLSFSGVKDIGESLKRLEVGSSLNAHELLCVSSLLTVCARAKSYDRSDDKEELSDSLTELFSELAPLTPVNNEIKRCIISEEEISDESSPGLRHVRRQIRLSSDRIHSAMQAALNSYRNYLQDAIITQRDGRYCLPVKAEYKSLVSGMVHDASSTGSTLFIEPASVVKLNNDLRELYADEKKEIEAVLAALSAELSSHTGELREDLKALTNLDVIFAKAVFSASYRGTEPVFNTEKIIDIKSARHPLIPREKVVPIDIRLGEEFDLLVITGPNTGGKTVSLKTTGLFTLMGQAGLHIPADEGSRLGIFDEVYADIGDEQSIEQSLSTFSAHMTNIVDILQKADSNSLCLFDELGAGTDPTEGAALAMAILGFLHNMKTRTVATTHYSELKIYALETEGVENACCEFDVSTLRPTYRLLIGIPGKSNAFAISKRLGLPDYIIDEARKHIKAEAESFEDVIQKLEADRIRIERNREETESYKKEIEILRSRIKAKESRIDESREKILRDARSEAQRILKDAKETADKTIRNINKLSSGAGLQTAVEGERQKLREKLKETESGLGMKVKGPEKPVSPKKLKIGDGVRLPLMNNITGTVSSLPDKNGNLFVSIGIMKSKVNARDIELINESTVSGPGISQKASYNGSGSSGKSSFKPKSMSVSPEINLIGMTTDEAIPVLDKYLDDAYLAHLSTARIVHGRGTGALKKAVHNHLKRLDYIKSYRLGEFGEGDTGVTIVTFK